MNNADLIVATLRAAGITHGFGVPSGNVLPLMEAMRTGGYRLRADCARGVGGLCRRRHGTHDGKARALHCDAGTGGDESDHGRGLRLSRPLAAHCHHLALMPAPNAAITKAMDLLRAAKRPVAVIGATATRMKTLGSLCAFVERHDIPFATATMAKGLIDEDHPLSVGCIERAKRQVQRAFLGSADLVIGLGYDTIEVEYEAWVGSASVLHVDIERADVDATVNVVHEVVGDLDASVERLAALPPTRNAWAPTALQRHRDEFQRLPRPPTAQLSPHQAIDVVRRVLPRDGVLAFD